MHKLPLEVSAPVGLMDMSVEHVLRMPPVHQRIKALKACVRQVLHVAVASGRRVRHEHVKAVLQHNLRHHMADAGFHFLLGVHAGTRLVAHRSPEPQNSEAVEIVDPVVDALAALRRSLPVPAVMISRHIEQRHVGHALEKFKVIVVQIAAGNNEIHVLHAVRRKEIP